MTKNSKPKVVFAPGCFDHFEGTQEELDQLTAELMEAIESGELFDNSRAVSIEELWETDPELAQQLIDQLSDNDKRTLQ